MVQWRIWSRWSPDQKGWRKHFVLSKALFDSAHGFPSDSKRKGTFALRKQSFKKLRKSKKRKTSSTYIIHHLTSLKLQIATNKNRCTFIGTRSLKVNSIEAIRLHHHQVSLVDTPHPKLLGTCRRWRAERGCRETLILRGLKGSSELVAICKGKNRS